MPEFLEDPSVLTKDKLKSELVANNVSLPPGDQRKDVYVQLYLQHLTSRNRATPDFSSDEEREATPIRGRGRPAGRKATKKTDKPKAEEKDDPDLSELSNEALKEELIKYGFKPGPILGSTRKVIEQKLLKLKQQGSVVSSKPLAADSSTADSGNQNGNTDSEHYSDNEEEPKLDLTFEKREPLRSRQKAQVTLRNRRTEQNESDPDSFCRWAQYTPITPRAWTQESLKYTAEDKDVLTELNVKRSGRSPPKDFTSDVKEFNSSAKPSEDAVETILKTGTAKTGRLQAVTKDTTRVSRRTPRKMVVAADPITFDDADITESAPVTETIIPASNQNLAYTTTYEHFESRQVVNKVPESFKHAETLLSVNDFSDLSRRTPKKHLISEKHLSLLQHVEADSPHKKVIDVDIIGYTKSGDLLNTALIEENANWQDSSEASKTRQLKITKFVTPVKKQGRKINNLEHLVLEKTFSEEKITERDILKDMFPHEVATPTGISASCRKPIKGAAGRPLNPRDFKMNEIYSSKYVPKYTPVVEVKAEKTKSKRSLPMWIKILLFVVLAVFCFLVYQTMETNEGNPFAKYLQGTSVSSKAQN